MVHVAAAILLITISSSHAGNCKSHFRLRQRCPMDYGTVLAQRTASSLLHCCFNCQRNRHCSSVMFDPVGLTCQENADFTDTSPQGCPIRQLYAQIYENSCCTMPKPEGAIENEDTTTSNNCSKPFCIVNRTCEIGFSYNPNNGCCVKYCEKYGRTFYPVIEKCIPNVTRLNRSKFKYETSASECLQLCVSETSFTCRSLKWVSYSAIGYWTNHTALTVPKSHALHRCYSQVYYQRNCA